MVLLLKPYLTSAQLLPALVVFRVVYYLLPLAIALVALVADEAAGSVERRRRVLAAMLGSIDRTAHAAAARGVHVSSRASCCCSRARRRRRPAAWSCSSALLPLGVIEVSHFIGSVAGAALLILSQGLARRLDAAYYLTSSGMLVGMAASLLKGFDYEEAPAAGGRPVPARAGAAGFRPACGVLRHAILGRLGRVAACCSRRVGLARVVRVQARRLLARAVVAVRASRRSVTVPARLGWRGHRRHAVRVRASHSARAARWRCRRRSGSGGSRRDHPRRSPHVCHSSSTFGTRR